jgi:hypothetical protein
MQPSEFIKPCFAVVVGWILSFKFEGEFLANSDILKQLEQTRVLSLDYYCRNRDLYYSWLRRDFYTKDLEWPNLVYSLWPSYFPDPLLNSMKKRAAESIRRASTEALYRPGGEGFLRAREHFYSLANAP